MPSEHWHDESWTLTATELPPENVLVWAMDGAGSVQQLKRSGGLWFIPDGSMYVYFTPPFWKEIK